ncbi:MAG: mannosyltransferase [Bacteroidetes bacterium]|nr:MAG: mannosyltransferase [Bacteroidota bacterium]
MRNSEFLLISSYPPRKCGIATYSLDLINAIENKYQEGFSLKVCALDKESSELNYSRRVTYVLKTGTKEDYASLAQRINLNEQIRLVFLQHEFGLYGGELGTYLLDFLKDLKVPVIVTFHTILSKPDDRLRLIVRQIVQYAAQIIVMTNHSAMILREEYQIELEKITVIPHGTHLIKPQKLIQDKDRPFYTKKILATFGLISGGKSIETALDALPRIVQHFPEVLYLIIGKTHPEVIKQEGEIYRNFLQQKTIDLGMDKHVLFINKYLSLQILLDYLERTDIYLFTSKDPQQAVSGTLAYAMSTGCPVISTPIPHSLELLDGAGINFEFEDSEGLADAALHMLSRPDLMQKMVLNALHKISPTAWQNSAIAHIELAKKVLKKENFKTQYRYPEISLDQVKRMSTEFGMLQFSKVAKPDKASGYTIDDNARALIAVAKNFELTGDFEDLHLINTYLNFILFCQQEDGSFLNYVKYNKKFYKKNHDENLEDANGRAIWALGQFLSMQNLISLPLQAKVEAAFQKALPTIVDLASPRAISFCIKGLYFHYQFKESAETLALITQLADNLISKYRGVSSEKWQWFEPYLSYANAVLPEALLLAGICTKSDLFKNTAKTTFDFLLSLTHDQEQISVISNVGRHDEGQEKVDFGQQPIEFAYTILALDSFYQEFREVGYLQKLKATFDWFLGDNHLHQIIYNPCTGGCYDGLEEDHINLNQGAESTLSYLLSRLTLEKYNT